MTNNFNKIRYDPIQHKQEIKTIRWVLFAGWLIAAIMIAIWTSLYHKYYYDSSEENEKIIILDSVGTVVIIIVGILYWFLLSRQRFGKNKKCLSPEITELWPHLAFRYGLGLGVVMPLLKLIPKKHNIENYRNNLEEFFPLIVLSLIMGSYMFMWIQYLFIDFGNCPSPLLPIKMSY